MKSTASIPLKVLLLVLLFIGISWYLTESDREYLFDGERGMRRPEVTDWWAFQLPAAIFVGLTAMLVCVGGLRCLRSGDIAGAVGQAAVGALGLLALASAHLYIGVRHAPLPEPPGLSTARLPKQSFMRFQWLDLAETSAQWAEGQWDGQPSKLNDNGIGLARRPELIPCDPYLLDRLTFAGLSGAEVQALLGPPPVDSGFRIKERSMVYLMQSYYSREYARAVLSLSLDGPTADPDSIVKGEHLSVSQPYY